MSTDKDELEQVDAVLELRGYLNSMVTMRKKVVKGVKDLLYYGLEDFLLKHGRSYEPALLPKKYRRGTPSLCFQNAYNLCKRHKKLLYVEGIALGVVIPVHHAWCVEIGSTKVIEPTWAGDVEVRGVAYYGVPFNLELVWKTRARESTVLDDWKEGWPLLSGKILEEEWRVQS